MSRKKRQFTIRLEERKLSGGVWVQTGRRRTYTVMDIQRVGEMFVDKSLFAMAFKSETRFRESEGRFFSRDEVFTLLRISPYDLGDFVKKCRQKRVLCDGEGNSDGFTFVKNVVPDAVFRGAERGDLKDDEIIFNTFDFTHVEELVRDRENVTWDETFSGLLAFDKKSGWRAPFRGAGLSWGNTPVVPVSGRQLDSRFKGIRVRRNPG